MAVGRCSVLAFRAGERMPVSSATEVLVELKRPPQAVFDRIIQNQADYFRFCLSPKVTISLTATDARRSDGRRACGTRRTTILS